MAAVLSPNSSQYVLFPGAFPPLLICVTRHLYARQPVSVPLSLTSATSTYRVPPASDSSLRHSTPDTHSALRSIHPWQAVLPVFHHHVVLFGVVLAGQYVAIGLSTVLRLEYTSSVLGGNRPHGWI